MAATMRMMLARPAPAAARSVAQPKASAMRPLRATRSKVILFSAATDTIIESMKKLTVRSATCTPLRLPCACDASARTCGGRLRGVRLAHTLLGFVACSGGRSRAAPRAGAAAGLALAVDCVAAPAARVARAAR